MSIFKLEGVTLEAMMDRNRNTCSEWMGIEFIEIGEDYLLARMPVDHRTIQPLGVVNGGAFCVLAETVGSLAANICIDREQFVAVGLDINANHIRPVKDGFVFATATSESIGRTTQIWSIRIEDEAGKLVCISRITMAVISTDRA